MAENEKLECLKRLQNVLQKKFELEKIVEALPANYREEEKKLVEANAHYLDLTNKYNGASEEYRSLVIKYDDASKKRTDYEKQMEFIQTQREYEALSKQLEEAKSEETMLLKSRNSKANEVKGLADELDAQERILDQQRQIVEAEKDKISDDLEAKKAEIAALDAECLDIKGRSITDELYNKFINIAGQKDGLGIVPVHGQVCTGCDMVLPMQFVIDLRLKQEKNEFDFCPYCSRIIYYEKLDDEEEKNFIFEQLEPTKSEGGKSSSHVDSSEDDSYDESMGGDFEQF